MAASACRSAGANKTTPPAPEDLRPRIIFDTDANNELDDQHAIAYLLFNSQLWNVVGITTNATTNGGPIAEHSAEVKRIVHLAGAENPVPVIDGENGTFEQILPSVKAEHDGKAAVDFILQQSRASSRPLTILAVGKLTNVALALARDPTLADRARLVWLGSNWPDDANEYNEADDRPSVNYVLDSKIPFDVVTVGGKSGTEKVWVSTQEIAQRMPGLGPKVSPIKGRHGGEFGTFGDYSVNLFEHSGDKHRALHDMATAAVLKNVSWAESQTLPAPRIEGKRWVPRPENPRTVRFFLNLNRDANIEDFYAVMQRPELVQAHRP